MRYRVTVDAVAARKLNHLNEKMKTVQLPEPFFIEKQNLYRLHSRKP
jgi:hypothetical protein